MHCLAFFVTVAGILFIAKGAKSCSSTPQDVEPTSKKINDSAVLLCHKFCKEPGQYIFEHFNQSTGQYDTIAQSYKLDMTINDISDGGSYRCWQSGCNNSSSSTGSNNPQYCYFTIEVLHPTIEMNFSPMNEHTNYTITCNATGNPVPVVHAKLYPAVDCPYTTNYTIVSIYMGQVAVTIPVITPMCYNVTVYCYVSPCKACPSMTLQALKGFHQTHNVTTKPPQTTPPPVVSKPQENETSKPQENGTSKPQENGTSSVDNTTTLFLLLLTLIGFIAVQ
ncbi:uncharacterized protein [Dysidea avara]|uniref:uncharacterized protein n=1 Tax=Dysidea avara TaxID=196820 RepID=UPI003327B0C1